MTDKTKIEKLAGDYVREKGLFLVAVRVSSTGRITVLADRKGGITIEECAELSRYLESKLDRDVEDYELQVSSPGIDMPFLVIDQYYKNEGKMVEVTDESGKKHSGILKNVTPGGFEIETESRVKGKGKITEKKDLSFNYEQVKSTREVLIFK